MRICLMTPEWSPAQGGGIGAYCRILASHAVRQGHQVRVLAPAFQDPAPTMLGLSITQVEGSGAAEPRAQRFAQVWARLARDGYQADVIEAAEFGGVAAYVAGRSDAPPVVTRLHTPLGLILRGDAKIYADDADRIALERRQTRLSALVTSPSQWLANVCRDMWNLSQPPVVAPNPVETIEPPLAARAPGGPLSLLYVGRLEHRKGVLHLADAAAPLVAGGLARLTIVGGDTRWRNRSMAEQIDERLSPMGPADGYARFPERRPEALLELLDAADLVVLPSLFENCPYACLEAMAAGRPVLATRGSGFEEIISHGRTGLLVSPGDTGALHAALRAAAAGRWRLSQIGARARKSMVRFEAEAAVRRLCGILLTASHAT